MITRQHSAITFMAHARKATVQTFMHEIPWTLLPDGIRAYSGPRQMSHFEQLPDGTDTAWMVFPTELTLNALSKENFGELVKFYRPEGYPKCVIGEATDIELFDTKNYANKHYHALRVHMVQDIVLDNTLRAELVDVTGRFRDEFKVKWNHQVIDGATLRQQVALFESIGFIHLAGKVCEATGKKMNNQWFKEYVFEPLMVQYPEDLAVNTFKYMRLSDEEDARITAGDFELTDTDKKDFILCKPDELEDILDKMYAEAYFYTSREF